MILLLLKSQPDIGMLAVVTVVFLAQLYVDGLPLVLVGVALGMIGGGSVVGIYDVPACPQPRGPVLGWTGDNYQVDDRT